MDNIKNLIIDLGGVLIGLNRQKCIDTFKEMGVENIDGLIERYVQDGIFGRHEQGLITDEEFHDGLRKLGNSTLQDWQIDQAWCNFLEDIPDYKIEFLKKAKKKYKVFLLSNTNNIHWQFVVRQFFSRPGYTIDDCFHKTFLSYEMKLVKPDAEIFRQLLTETGIVPQETLFIDDSAENCRSAEQLGIKTYTPQPYEDWTVKI